MKVFISLLFSIFILGASVASAGPKVLEGENPFPWGSELPFPWESIEGVWVAQSVGDTDPEDYRVYSFEVISESDGERSLRVYELNPWTFEIIAHGLGSEFDKIVRSVMITSAKDYTMVVRAFPMVEESASTWGESDMVIALSVRTRGAFGVPHVVNHFAMLKISTHPVPSRCQTPSALCN